MCEHCVELKTLVMDMLKAVNYMARLQDGHLRPSDGFIREWCSRARQLCTHDDYPPTQEAINGVVPHIVREGARYHVVAYDSSGAHCSESRCELNERRNNV